VIQPEFGKGSESLQINGDPFAPTILSKRRLGITNWSHVKGHDSQKHAGLARKEGRASSQGSYRADQPSLSGERYGDAAARCGLARVSVASFVVDSAQRAAERVIEEETRWRLNESETAKLATLLANPPQVNEAARKAQVLAADVEIRS